MQFSYRYSLTEKDCLDFNYFSSACSKNARMTRAAGCIISAVIVLAELFMAIREGEREEILKNGIMLLIFPIVVWLIFRYIIPAITMPFVKKSRAWKHAAMIGMESEITFFDDRVSDRSLNSINEFAYSRIIGISVSGYGDVYLWLSTDTATLIPSRVFSCDDERRALLGMLIAKTGIKVDDLYYR